MEIREATKKDKKAIASLCRRSIRHDYVPMFLDDYIREGGLFIALDAGSVVGMVKHSRCPGGDGWLGAGRTDPNYRRRGVGTAVVAACCRHSASKGASFVRLWSNRSNKPAQIAVRSMGFKDMGPFVRVMKRVRVKRGRSSLRPERDVKTVNSLLHGSQLLEESEGYVGVGNRFIKMNSKAVSELTRAGKMFRTGDGICWIEDRAWGDVWTGVIEFSILAGDPESLLKEVETYTRQRGFTELHVYFPAKTRALQTSKRLGFKTVSWGSDVVLFEKRVR